MRASAHSTPPEGKAGADRIHLPPDRRELLSVASAAKARLRGPGGMYNLGNAIALAAGLGLQLAAIQPGTGIGAAIYAYFFGSPGATWLSIAILIFLVSGEVYHRAWINGAPPLTHLNRIGDMLSALAAIALSLALLKFGDVGLAIVSGTCLFGGKIGTAILPEDPSAPAGRNRWSAIFRSMVLASRVPAIAALSIEIFSAFAIAAPGSAFAPALMVLCYAIWFRADLMLLPKG